MCWFFAQLDLYYQFDNHIWGKLLSDPPRTFDEIIRMLLDMYSKYSAKFYSPMYSQKNNRVSSQCEFGCALALFVPKNIKSASISGRFYSKAQMSSKLLGIIRKFIATKSQSFLTFDKMCLKSRHVLPFRHKVC